MKKILKNIIHISRQGGCTQIGEYKFYGVPEKQQFGNNMEITYEEKDVEVLPEIAEERDADGEVVQEFIPAVMEKRKFVTSIVVLESEEQKKKKIELKEREKIQKATLEELLAMKDLSGAHLTGQEKGKLLSEKFFGDNIYKELQLHRLTMKLLLKVAVQKQKLTAKELGFIQSMNDMDAKAGIILSKM